MERRRSGPRFDLDQVLDGFDHAEDLRDRDVETWDLHGDTQEVGLWLEGLDDTSVTELESALQVLRVRASLPGKPAPPAVVQQLPATDAPPVVAEVSSDAGDDGGDAEDDGPVADAPREPCPSKAESRPVRDLLCHLRDAGVERIGEGEESSWAVRGVLDRLDLSDIKHRELAQISAAAERAALQLPPSAAERRADSRARGARIARCIARLRAMEAEGKRTVQEGGFVTIAEVLSVRGWSDDLLEETEISLFGATGEETPPSVLVGGVAVGNAEDVAEMLNGMNLLAQVGGFRDALARIGELQAELAAAQAREADLRAEVNRLEHQVSLLQARVASQPANAADPLEAWRWAIEDRGYDAQTIANMSGLDVEVINAARGAPAPADIANDPQPTARALDEVPEQLRLVGLLVGTLPDRDVAAATHERLLVVRGLRKQLGLSAPPSSPTPDQLSAHLQHYAAADLTQLAFLLNVPPGERLVERLALEIAGRAW